MDLEGDVLVLVDIWARECGVEVMCVCVCIFAFCYSFLCFCWWWRGLVAFAGWVGDMRAQDWLLFTSGLVVSYSIWRMNILEIVNGIGEGGDDDSRCWSILYIILFLIFFLFILTYIYSDIYYYLSESYSIWTSTTPWQYTSSIHNLTRSTRLRLSLVSTTITCFRNTTLLLRDNNNNVHRLSDNDNDSSSNGKHSEITSKLTWEYCYRSILGVYLHLYTMPWPS